MNLHRKRFGLGSVLATGKEKLAAVSDAANASTARFKGKLGAAIAAITSLIVGFLVIPNNILYLIDDSRALRLASPATSAAGTNDYEYVYIHVGIAVIVLGCLAMVVSIVLSYFAAKSKVKSEARGTSAGTRTVFTCLIMMNIELFMAIIAGCMELLYRPLTKNTRRLHTVECTIAIFNIVIYVMYVVTMILTGPILKGKRERYQYATDNPEAVSYHRHPSQPGRDGNVRAATYDPYATYDI